MEFFTSELMYRSLAACLIIAGMHVYLGLHVVSRGVIFVDLALAQLAALGTTMGVFLGFDIHSTSGYLCGMAFTVVGATIFTFSRSRKPIVPQEALIGIVYAVSAAASILVLSRLPEGGEELKETLVGHLLFVEWREIFLVLALYAAAALLHWFIRKPLLLISTNPDEAYARGYRVRLWDFVFYVTFGFVVTTAVQTTGVLLVFAFLIVPAVCGVFLARSIAGRLLVGWLVGGLASFAGIYASFEWDLPTGAAVVCTFGVAVVLCAGLGLIANRGNG